MKTEKMSAYYGPMFHNKELEAFYQIIQPGPSFDVPSFQNYTQTVTAVKRNSCCRYIRGQTMPDKYVGKRLPN